MFNRFFSSTSHVVKDMVDTVTPAAVAGLAHTFIQQARTALDDAVKATVKSNYSALSSLVNVLMVGGSLAEFLAHYTETEVWENLTNKERIGVAAVAVVALGGGIYSGCRFGIEQNTLWAGLAAAGSVGLFKVAKYAAEMLAARHEVSEENTRLFVPAPSV